jgi:ribokinase
MEVLLHLHAVGFGSLNLDEFWEVSSGFMRDYGLTAGEEYVRDVTWFKSAYRALASEGRLVTVDPGGSAANMIAALHRMGFETGFYGAAGRDDAVKLRLHELGRQEDLRVRLVDVPSGRCLAMIDRDDPARDRSLVILPNANDLAGNGELDLTYFGQASWVHLTSFVASAPLAAQIRLVETLPKTVKIGFDPGAVYAPLGMAVLRPILGRTDVLFVTTDELEHLTGICEVSDAAAALLDMGTGVVVAKMGAAGIQAFLREKTLCREAIPPRHIKDRTGAGDVAAAGFLAGMMQSLDIETCLEIAARAASASIEGYGRSAYPDRAFFERFLSSRQRG